jgi:hypothetical protein
MTKIEQFQLLKTNSLLAEYLPETALYTAQNLHPFLIKFDHIYVKHNSSGQGRGIFKLGRKQNGEITYSGYTFQGIEKSGIFKSVKAFDKILNPLARLGKTHKYIMQEGIKSVDQNGNPVNFRVHVQRMKDGWVVGGIKGAVGIGTSQENGIVNRNR